MQKREFYEDLAKQVFAGMNSKDFESLKPVLSDDIVFYFPGTSPVEGPRRVILFLNALIRKYKNLTFKITDIVIDEGEHKACVVWTNFGQLANGIEYQNSGITLLKFSDHKILLLSDYFKDTSFTSLL
jgi:ketosteroid isomerase-like protein